MSFSYRVLYNALSRKCGNTDAQLKTQVTSLGLDRFQGAMVDGSHGTCARATAEQFKRLYPDKLVLNYQLAFSYDPSQMAGSWPGYFAMMNRTKATSIPTPTATVINVASSAAFNVGDLALLWAPTATDPFGAYEYVAVTAVTSPTSVTVSRGSFGSGPTTFTANPFLAALYTDPYFTWPIVNFSLTAPVNPANGKRAVDWLVAHFVADFAPSAGAPALDGIEFDAIPFKPKQTNQNGATKNLDCDADGVIDYCVSNPGLPTQGTSWSDGYSHFLAGVRTSLSATYDAPGTTTPKLVIADQRPDRAGSATGAEFESFPNWDNYNLASSALSNLDVFEQSTSDSFVYAYTKDITPLYPTVSRLNPSGCIVPPAGTCRNASFRYGLAASAITGSGFTYNDESNYWNVALPLDEEGTINSAVTGLTPGGLGVPLGPPVRQTRYTSGVLDPNPGFDAGLAGWTVARLGGTARATLVQDTTAPAVGTASLRVGVSAVSVPTSAGDVIVSTSVGAVTASSEYAITFWAKATDAAGGAYKSIRVALDGSTYAQDVFISNQWRQYTLNIATTSAKSAAKVKLLLGAEPGSYWFDDFQVHNGNAGIITREFTNGIVVMNDSVFPQTNISLPNGPYRTFQGVQDPSVNTGRSVGSLLPKLADKDGIVLLR